ncbi:MAG: response regulator [Thalassolituus sp.]|jgi:signal transduction histidine kinase|uniref:hybrid sensor histidine kinase/response regulator n=1 Tax=Thalassolituus sp. TaxID=2030822 RepID=UPI0027D6EDFC|nr:ATP-binding protein [Thalassolituus sp.]MDQ4423237.1 response regulator [Thalassolituus sp.]MDQ4427586.1 response regulator [Thalassolituus sp.]
MRISHWSIRRRAIVLAAVPAFLTVVLLTVMHMSQRLSDAGENSESTVRLMVESISASAEYPVISGNYELLAPLMDAALGRPEIAAVRVLDPLGLPLIERTVEGYDELGSDDLRVFQKELSRTVIDLDPMDMGGLLEEEGSERSVTFAVIEIAMTDHYLHAREMEILYQSVVAGVLVVLLAALTGRYIALMIVRPLERTAAFLSSLSGGDYWNRIEESDGAELGRVQSSGNRLAEALERAQNEQRVFTSRLLEEQKKARSASESKSQFLAMMSHELRTPLNGALGMLELMNHEMAQCDFSLHKEQAEQSLVQLAQLLDDIMVVADTDQKSVAAAPEYCLLSEYFESFFEVLKSRAMSQGLSFITDIQGELREKPILTYPGLLRQILRHLVDNALKFTVQGVVSVSMVPEKSGVRIIVSDTGIGIPPSEYDSIIEPFTQLESDLNRQYEGAGLGLTITSHVVNALRGELHFSEPEGGGCHVEVTLPEVVLAPTDPTDTTTILSLPSSLNGDHTADSQGASESGAVGFLPEDKGKLLIVEDNEVNLKVAEKMLARIHPDREVLAVMSGEAALIAVEEQRISLVLMDCQMPGMDGFETSQKLREGGFSGAIIACTANTTDQVEERCLASGMNDYMAKPISLKGLTLITERWLENAAT